MTAILFVGTAAIATLPHCAHWRLEDDENASISGPATRLIQKQSEALQRAIKDNGDTLALALALLAVFGPRVQQTVKEINDDRKRASLGAQLYAPAEDVRPGGAGAGSRDDGTGVRPVDGAGAPTGSGSPGSVDPGFIATYHPQDQG